MRYFAEISNGIVARVIVAPNALWCSQNLGGEWVETFMDQAGHHYAGKGYSYRADRGNFVAPQPFPSWKLDETDLRWKPGARFLKNVPHRWNEVAGVWIETRLVDS